MNTPIKTSVIGSYPISIDTPSLMNDYFTQKQTTWNQYITQAADEMIQAGIDMISDGQTRDPMVEIFTRNINGCRVRNRSEIIDKLSYVSPITISDQEFIRSHLPKNTQLIGILTGPFTLMKSCTNSYYDTDKDICYDFAHILHKEAKNLVPFVDLISIDEPFFSNELPEYAADLISIITKGISLQTRLHVCGDVSGIIDQLLDLPVDILSHEFKASPELIDAFGQYTITKQICFGSVRSDDPRVEPVDEIVDHIQRGRRVFDGSIVQISPDCGQRFLPKDVAFQKLCHLVQAGEQING